MHLPNATYRIQLNHLNTFEQVASLIPYFKSLGITDLYLSPIFQAQRGSMHGYDTIDFAQISSELGGIEGLRTLSHLAQKNHLNLFVDIVPNHMAATEENRYWQEVSQKGCSSKYSNFFDIKWKKSSAGHLVYRRFFDIDELVCLNAERKEVFQMTHQLLLKLIDEKLIQGIRIDHIDGLREPANYLKRLKNAIGIPFYIIAEKILGYDEKIPPDWPLLGTTGYEFLNHCNQLFITKEGLNQLKTIYDKFTHNKQSIFQIKLACLKQVILTLFAEEFHFLCVTLQEILEHKLKDIREMLLQWCALMPVYRLYNEKSVAEYNAQVVAELFAQVTLDNPLSAEFKNLLLDQFTLTEDKKKQWTLWRSNWEVFTGPVMAKGFEDTTCYNYYALSSLNEVGTCLENFASCGELNRFHNYAQHKQKYFPYSLNTTSTHDTKRSEDTRARINVLSELSEEWEKLLNQWVNKNEIKKTIIKEHPAPDSVDEMLIYQTLLGTWPLHLRDNEFCEFKQRIKKYLTKAIRERKQHSSWHRPNKSYECASSNFFDSLLMDTVFMEDFLAFQNSIAWYGMYNSLSQIVLKLCAPGVPDIYQGNESWRFDLVDPDNRRLINYEHLRTLNSDLPLPRLMQTWKDGRVKYNLTRRLLSLRTQYKKLFLHGSYIPLQVQGSASHHVIGFLRQYKHEWLAVIVCRWFTRLIPPGADWSTARFLNDACTLPDNCTSLINNHCFKSNNNDFLISDILQDLPFNILKNA